MEYNFSKQLVPFAYKKIRNKFLIVNDWGHYLLLDKKEFDLLRTDKDKTDLILEFQLEENNFYRDRLKVGDLVHEYSCHRKHYLEHGPSLFIFIPTLRCNHACLYCHASARGQNDSGFDMDKKTASQALDIAFSTTSPEVVIELQGGEPLLNLPVTRYIIDQAVRRNKTADKELEIRLVTNGALLSDSLIDYFTKMRVSLCLSLDGPADLHDAQRPSRTGNYRKLSGVIKKLNRKYARSEKQGYRFKTSTSLTVTKATLSRAKEAIDDHIRLGLDSINLRYLNRFGVPADRWRRLGYSAREFIRFYRQSLDYIIELNRKDDKIFFERFTQMFLQKILAGHDPNHMEWRSPCGAGLGQLAFNYNGNVYTCDEGRMLSMAGDESFRLGSVADTYEQLVTSPTVKTMAAASCLESLPGCERCVYRSYCGVCPIYNYYEYGNLFATVPGNGRCQIAHGVLDYIFEQLADPETEIYLRRWVE